MKIELEIGKYYYLEFTNTKESWTFTCTDYGTNTRKSSYRGFYLSNIDGRLLMKESDNMVSLEEDARLATDNEIKLFLKYAAKDDMQPVIENYQIF